MIGSYMLIFISLFVASAALLLAFCSAQTAMLAIFALSSGCIVPVFLFAIYNVMSWPQNSNYHTIHIPFVDENL
ncbi:MAG: hypothetical protein LBG86_01580 [Puniceicoccales bacterium]|jgi:hypothetical protein|nr:hypothetical protein [Puniceicoccales bacterium]